VVIKDAKLSVGMGGSLPLPVDCTRLAQLNRSNGRKPRFFSAQVDKGWNFLRSEAESMPAGGVALASIGSTRLARACTALIAPARTWSFTIRMARSKRARARLIFCDGQACRRGAA
jgi:hypothetical protein